MDLKIEYINIDDLVPNQWNPNIQDEFIQQRTRRSIEKFGFVDPITVRTKDGIYEIIDGEHRWKEAKNAKMETVPIINLGEIVDTVARQLTIVLNETRGEFDTIKLSELLVELQKEVNYDELLNDLPYPKEELDSLLALPEFDWSEFDTANDVTDDTENNQMVFEVTVEDKEADKFRGELKTLSEQFPTLRYSEK